MLRPDPAHVPPTSRSGPPPAARLDGASDRVLIDRIAKGEQAAFEIVYDRHIGPCHALAARMTRNDQAADDVCQEAFIMLWRSAHRYDARYGTSRTWLLTITRNRAIDHLRRADRLHSREVADLGIADRHPAPADEATATAALRHLRAHEMDLRMLDVLSAEQREVIELAFYDGYTYHEIATQLRLPLSTTKSRISRGLTRLRGALPADARSA